ncbi:MAG TPA: signal peptidase I [Sulfurovum sp.]|nr:signal peptidase I [Sulfurovum sp.]
MKKFLSALYRFSGTWTGAILFVLIMIFFVAQSFVIPSGSMKRSMLIGDFLFAKKFSYGISIPELPWVGLKLLPDFNGNGHLIEGDRPKREDIVIFYVPTNKKTHFVKRCVAVGGDEIIYYDKHLLLHLNEGDEYIKKNYPKEKIISLLGKLWVTDPYKEKYLGIQYEPEYNANSFLLMLQNIDEVDMKPLFIKDLKTPVYSLDGTPINVFYAKVKPDNFYMIGDNRDNSQDSRFWGSVPYSLVIGQPWFTYFSLEYRSYDRVMNGNGGGRDHQKLSSICGDTKLASKECEELWNNYRFSIRWSRIGRSIKSIENEAPTSD